MYIGQIIMDLVKDWLSDNAVWLGGSAAIIAVIEFFRLIFSIFFKPKIKIYFDPKETYHQLPEVNSGKDSFWLHLMVKNKSWFKDIKGIQGFITSVWILKGNRKYIYPHFRSSIKLKWAHENDFGPRNIIRRDKRRLDICFALENDRRLFFSTEYYPSGTQRFLYPGEYILKIVLIGENLSRSQGCLLRVSWNGRYTELRGMLYRKNLKEVILGLSRKKIEHLEFKGDTGVYPSEADQYITQDPGLIDEED